MGRHSARSGKAGTCLSRTALPHPANRRAGRPLQNRCAIQLCSIALPMYSGCRWMVDDAVQTIDLSRTGGRNDDCVQGVICTPFLATFLQDRRGGRLQPHPPFAGGYLWRTYQSRRTGYGVLRYIGSLYLKPRHGTGKHGSSDCTDSCRIYLVFGHLSGSGSTQVLYALHGAERNYLATGGSMGMQPSRNQVLLARSPAFLSNRRQLPDGMVYNKSLINRPEALRRRAFAETSLAGTS